MPKDPVYVTHEDEIVTFNGVPIIYQNTAGMRGMSNDRRKETSNKIDFVPGQDEADQFDFRSWIEYANSQTTTQDKTPIKTETTKPEKSSYKRHEYAFLNELQNHEPKARNPRLSLIPALVKKKS